MMNDETDASSGSRRQQHDESDETIALEYSTMCLLLLLPLSSFPASPWSCGSIQIIATKVCARIDFLCCVVGYEQ